MGSGMRGTLKLTGIVATLLLGGLATLVVLDLLPREQLQGWGIKLLMVAGILALVTVIVAMLSRKE